MASVALPYLSYLIAIGIAVGLNLRAGHWRAWSAPTLLTAGLLLAFAVFVTVITDTPWFGDFESAYFPAGSLILSDPVRMYAENCVEGFVNLPIVAALFIPFAWLDYTTSAVLFTLLGAVAIVGTAGLLCRMFARGPAQTLAVLSLIALSGPLLYSVREGNTTHLIFLFLLLALTALQQGRFFLAGLVLGACAVVKVPIAIFGLYFLVKGRWSTVAGMAAMIAATVVASFLWLGPEVHAVWLERCVLGASSDPIAAFNVQSVDGLLSRFYGGSVMDWTPFPVGGSYPVVRGILLAALGAGVAYVLWRSRRGQDSRSLATDFAVVLLFAVLVFPISWTHYYLFLLLPSTLLVTGQLQLPRGWLWSALAATAILAVSLPLRLPPYPGNPVVRQIIDMVFVSHYFLGGLLLLFLLIRGGYRAVGSGLPHTRM